MDIFYKIANSIRRAYWFIFRPKTQGVKCLIENNCEYLLIQTSYSGKYWTLPGGGIKQSENPEQAAKREVKEELGIILDKVNQIGRYESTVEYKKDTIHLFYATVETKDFKSNTEVSLTGWFSKNEFPKNISRAIKESIALISG